MKCPYCGFAQDRVVDSRESKDADAIRRRRECEGCNKRFTTYERIDEIPYMVVKKDGRREKFDRQKILGGLLHACQKRPISGVALERIVDETEAYVVDSPERERTPSEVGELIMSRLKDIDTVGVYPVRERVPGLQGCARTSKLSWNSCWADETSAKYSRQFGSGEYDGEQDACDYVDSRGRDWAGSFGGSGAGGRGRGQGDWCRV